MKDPEFLGEAKKGESRHQSRGRRYVGAKRQGNFEARAGAGVQAEINLEVDELA
jgi:hypothetical protein